VSAEARPPVIYIGPVDQCDLCEAPFASVMFDARTKRGWGNLCPACFADEGCSVGTGRGQMYELQQVSSGKAWVKVAG